MAQKPELNIGTTAVLETQPSPKAVGKSKGGFTIGLPCESSKTEKRIALTPDSVSVLVRNGIQVLVEKGAGIPANFEDEAYAKAGAEISFLRSRFMVVRLSLKWIRLQWMK